MELSDHLREMLKELGQAINESISGSGRVHDSIQRIRDEGYNLYMVLDAKVGVNRREPRLTRARKGSVARKQASEGDEGNDEKPFTERAAFRINLKDLHFLRSLGIDPTRKVRVRKVVARKAVR
jgi:hypothetical protein